MIASPCIKVCEMDSASRLCRGCGRTLEEIARWGSLSDSERDAIMATLSDRLKKANFEGVSLRR